MGSWYFKQKSCQKKFENYDLAKFKLFSQKNLFVVLEFHTFEPSNNY